jgi:hypothetical protein
LKAIKKHVTFGSATKRRALLRCPLSATLEKGLRIGLGTNISGGPTASMFDALAIDYLDHGDSILQNSPR